MQKTRLKIFNLVGFIFLMVVFFSEENRIYAIFGMFLTLGAIAIEKCPNCGRSILFSEPLSLFSNDSHCSGCDTRL